ncbi:MAG: ATP-binding protein [Candidatus Methanoplasma sp.]|jgi:predicted AAA+ superfamily ATPase|nr:ATP-binding protein [Candidatus Methanoplasma sp.]
MEPIARPLYINRLMSFKDTPFIKMITGVRRCGKSTLLDLLEKEFISSGIPKEKIIRVNLDSMEWKASVENWKELYSCVRDLLGNGKNYVMIDEIQNVPGWEEAAISMFTDMDADLYITGSNAVMLSPDLGSKLVGRYVEIEVLPLSFSEYLTFIGSDQDPDRIFTEYVRHGGFPAAALMHDRPQLLETVIDGIFHTIVDFDIAGRNAIGDRALISSLAAFLIGNVGNTVSAKSISDYLSSNGRKVNHTTIDNYLLTMERSFLFYKVKRYDIQSRNILKTLDKYYVVDTGIRSLISASQDQDYGRVLENVVYLELLRRGYKVSIGKIGTEEVDFIAAKGSATEYYQVTYSMSDEGTRKRELTPLRKIKDSHRKLIISADRNAISDYGGILNLNIVDWLLWTAP